MNPGPASPDDQFFREQARTVDQAAKLVGSSQGWQAPISFPIVNNRFVEEVRLDRMPTTVIAVRLSGAEVRCCFGKQRGAIDRGHSPSRQPKGHFNHFIARGLIRFAQIFLPDALIDRIGNALEMKTRASLVAERLLDRHYTFVARPAPKGDLARWLFARVRDVLSTAVTDQPTLGAPATEVERSQFHLTPAFHASMEMPPHRSLIELQIRSTRQLMANSNLSVTEISAQVGYDDSGYFARLFRRHIGTTPAAYWRERRS